MKQSKATASIYAVIPAAGNGTRMGLTQNKVFASLRSGGTGQNSILSQTVRSILRADVCRGIVLVIREADRDSALQLQAEIAAEESAVEILLVEGGRTRQQSVYNALSALSDKAPEWVLIHDGARPFCSAALIRSVIETAQACGAAILATPARQTLKSSADGLTIDRTVSRAEIWEAQTPQVFRYKRLLEAHQEAAGKGFEATDDSQLCERIGETVVLVPGNESNVKITTPFDLAVAEALLDSE